MLPVLFFHAPVSSTETPDFSDALDAVRQTRNERASNDDQGASHHTLLGPGETSLGFHCRSRGSFISNSDSGLALFLHRRLCHWRVGRKVVTAPPIQHTIHLPERTEPRPTKQRKKHLRSSFPTGQAARPVSCTVEKGRPCFPVQRPTKTQV